MPLARAPHHQLANRQLFCLIQVKRPPGLSSTPSNGYCRKSEPIHNVEHQPPLQQGPFRSPFNSTVSTMQSSEGVAKLSLSRTRLSATSASKLYVAPSINNLFNARLHCRQGSHHSQNKTLIDLFVPRALSLSHTHSLSLPPSSIPGEEEEEGLCTRSNSRLDFLPRRNPRLR